MLRRGSILVVGCRCVQRSGRVLGFMLLLGATCVLAGCRHADNASAQPKPRPAQGAAPTTAVRTAAVPGPHAAPALEPPGAPEAVAPSSASAVPEPAPALEPSPSGGVEEGSVRVAAVETSAASEPAVRAMGHRVRSKRGADMLYPWGNDRLSPKGAAYAKAAGVRQPCASRIDHTPEGLCDMALNLSEWTSTRYPSNRPDEEWRVFQGNNFRVTEPGAEIDRVFSYHRPDIEDSPSMGVRCARDAD